jgi:hypothetical protein
VVGAGAVGLSDERNFAKYRHVLNRAAWSSRQISQGWGEQIKARGIYRDAVRFSASHFVKTSGLRWISLMSVPVRQTAWYHKPAPTFSDALAWVRHLLWWHSATFSMSPAPLEMLKLPKPFVLRLVNSLAYAA